MSKPKRPLWWVKALRLRVEHDLSNAEIAEKLKKKVTTVQHALGSPWAKQKLRDIEAKALERMVEAGVDPILQCQVAAPEMAQTMIQASREEPKPFQRAMIAKDVLALGGFSAEKRVHVTVEAKIRECSDEELEAFERTGTIPQRLRSQLLLPAAEQVIDVSASEATSIDVAAAEVARAE